MLIKNSAIVAASAMLVATMVFWGKWSSDICSGRSQLQRRHERIVQWQASQGSRKGSVDINLECL